MVAGLILGWAIPDLNDALDGVKVDSVSLPIALGLLLMMYPVLAKVKYTRISGVISDRRTLLLSLI
ncbi:MAG: arsenical-resistance protein, partial [Actinomycetota bacterium]